MGEQILVTLRAENFERDYELPANTTLQDLYPRILAALKKTSPRTFGDYSEIVLESRGAGLLKMDASLVEHGVRTGYILDVVRKEKYYGF